jgi:predicted secreted protein
MSLTFAIAIYFIVWWITLFAVLPFNVRTQDEAGAIVPGTPESAPSEPKLLRIIVTNTIVATLVFAVVWSIIVYEWIDLDLFQLKSSSPV